MHSTDDAPIRSGPFWIWPDGTIRPVISGGSDDTDDDAEGSEPEGDESGSDEGADGDDSDSDDGGKPLGPAGEKALVAEKEKRRKAQAELREWKALGLSAADIKKLVDAQSGGQPDPDVVQREADQRANQKANERILRSEIKAAATGKLNNPALALKLLDLDKFDVDDDGNVDEDEIAEAIDDLLKQEPGLAAQGGRRFQGGADGGSRKETGPKQLTRADLTTMSPEQIVAAKAEGQLAKILEG